MRALLLSVALLVACSSDDHGHDSTRPAVCDEIAKACHAFENIPEAKTCHEEAHEAWDATRCTAERSRCLALCVASDAATDASSDTAPIEAGADAADGG